MAAASSSLKGLRSPSSVAQQAGCPPVPGFAFPTGRDSRSGNGAMTHETCTMVAHWGYPDFFPGLRWKRMSDCGRRAWISSSTISASRAQALPFARKLTVDSRNENTTFVSSPMRPTMRSKYNPASAGGTWDRTEKEIMKSGFVSAAACKVACEMTPRFGRFASIWPPLNKSRPSR